MGLFICNIDTPEIYDLLYSSVIEIKKARQNITIRIRSVLTNQEFFVFYNSDNLSMDLKCVVLKFFYHQGEKNEIITGRTICRALCLFFI
jgi:hypothetical protein